MAARVTLVNSKTKEIKAFYTVDAKEILRGQQARGEKGPWSLHDPDRTAPDLKREAEKPDAARHEAFKHKEGTEPAKDTKPPKGKSERGKKE